MKSVCNEKWAFSHWLGPHNRHVTFLHNVFWIKGCWLGPCLRHVTFLQNVFWIKGWRLGPRVCHVTFFGSKEFRWTSMKMERVAKMQNEVAEILKCCCKNQQIVWFNQSDSAQILPCRERWCSQSSWVLARCLNLMLTKPWGERGRLGP